MNNDFEDSDKTDRLISALLDEVYLLRKAMAYEALKTKELFVLKTLPKRARERMETQLFRLIGAARGRAPVVYSYQTVNRKMWEQALHEAGVDPGLTRGQFEESIGLQND